MLPPLLLSPFPPAHDIPAGSLRPLPYHVSLHRKAMGAAPAYPACLPSPLRGQARCQPLPSTGFRERKR